jgi:t-SNARE complex subunit (syntaxin)
MQEANPIETREIVASTAGGFLPSLSNLLNTLAKPAADIYAAKLNNKVLTQQLGTQSAVAEAEAAQARAAADATAATSASAQQKYLVWGIVGVVVVVVLAVILRRR